eukprot:GHVS01024001.1.p1 GENE.GHVS01024001.1~~GHVS01024001.1.p1  ORF type:complete len:543 (-),score=10.42 GHVS01024001.1:122-1750(-)
MFAMCHSRHQISVRAEDLPSGSLQCVCVFADGVPCEKVVIADAVENYCKHGLNIFLGFALFDPVGGIPRNTGYFEEHAFSDGLLFPVYRTFRNLQLWHARVVCEMRYGSGHVCFCGKILRTNDEKREAFYSGMDKKLLNHLNRDSNCSTYKDRKTLNDVTEYVTTQSEKTRRRKIPHTSDQVRVTTGEEKRTQSASFREEGTEILTSAIDVRAVARVQASRLNNLGYSLLNAFEYELMLYPEGTDTRSSDPQNPIRFARSRDISNASFHWKALLRALNEYQIPLQTFQKEYGRNQYEIVMKPAFDIRGADNAYNLRSCLNKQLSSVMPGYKYSFMTKPYEDSGANGCHINQSLWLTAANGCVDATPDAEHPSGLSTVARSFIAGQLDHMKAICAFAVPDVNSYKRLEPHTFAPQTISWGFENRTACIRVKTGQNCYWENRLGCAPLNPYLMYAVSVAAGIDGIHRGLDLPESACVSLDHEDAKPELLPRSLDEAIIHLNNDKAICNALGYPIVKAFSGVKQREVELIQTEKSSEWSLYFDSY